MGRKFVSSRTIQYLSDLALEQNLVELPRELQYSLWRRSASGHHRRRNGSDGNGESSLPSQHEIVATKAGEP
jgi:hypothetical protein